ncbi:MAG: sulfatase-like hydrolase/transferase [Planctomycetes bacterium]|nr:sulfatase-like hydrolase/transferase [Planctomycetota bacterium]MBL7042658.1 sulfatase-like hydrolase/transferase [Pirellulaceae bacterium]
MARQNSDRPRHFVQRSIWVGLVLAMCCGTKSHAENPPNILFIMTDQQHAGMMSCTGNRWLQTPAMDRLARSGMRFELAYSPNPVCVPSRTSMMTGLFPSTLGFESNGDAQSARIPESVLQHTMGRLLRQAGYDTVFGGKTHWARGLNRGTCGFDNLTRNDREELADACVDFLRQEHTKPFLLVASFINPHDICYVEIDATIKRYELPPFAPGARVEREKIAQAVRLAEQAKRQGNFDELCPPLIENHGITEDEPQAITVRPTRRPPPGEKQARHVYYYMPDYVRQEWTEDDWRMHHWIYHRLTEDVDRQIDVVLKALQETGLDKNTIVIFTSDHGDMDGAHKRVHKSYFYDESARVPFIIAGPGVQSGVDREHLISSSLDLIPTICDFAGVDIPTGLAGESIRSLALGRPVPNWRKAVYSENGRGRMVRTARYKYNLYKQGTPRDMLIDMANDPGEMKNLAVDAKYAEVIAEHRQLIRDHVQGHGDAIFRKYVD